MMSGHSILSNEDKCKFDSLQDQILNNKQISWAENINNSVRQQSHQHLPHHSPF
jgi:hypothetical protein